MMQEPVVAFSKVTKTFQRDGAPFTACSNLNFEIHRGEVVAIVGETGCGKSTALSLLLGLQQASSGSVRVLGNDPFVQFQSLKGQVGIIFQNDRLLPWRSAVDNVAFGLEILHVPRAERLERARGWL